MVNPGDDSNLKRSQNAKSEAAQSANSFANRTWYFLFMGSFDLYLMSNIRFCRICYFYEDVGRNGQPVKMFHAQWFEHGSKTQLQETAHPQALYFVQECDNNPAASIFRKCEVDMLIPEDEEPIYLDPDSDEFDPESTKFFCKYVCFSEPLLHRLHLHRSYMWNREDFSFTDLPTQDEVEEAISLVPGNPCLSCAYKVQDANRNVFRCKSGQFSQYGVTYHTHDFIYIRPSANDGIFKIAQITNISREGKINVRYFGRYDDLVLSQAIADVKDEVCI